MRFRNQSSDGFTLVEIMIVVAIVGLLAAIALPMSVRARTTSQKATCINNLRQIEGATQQWALEYKQAYNAPVGYSDVSQYLRNKVTCPSGGVSGTFASCYQLTLVSERPTCIISPSQHQLPIETSN